MKSWWIQINLMCVSAQSEDRWGDSREMRVFSLLCELLMTISSWLVMSVLCLYFRWVEHCLQKWQIHIKFIPVLHISWVLSFEYSTAGRWRSVRGRSQIKKTGGFGGAHSGQRTRGEIYENSQKMMSCKIKFLKTANFSVGGFTYIICSVDQ